LSTQHIRPQDLETQRFPFAQRYLSKIPAH